MTQPAPAPTSTPAPAEAIIRVRDITVQFGSTRVLDGLSLDVKRGEILGFVGPSGAGKSVLTRTIIGLVPKVSGTIEVFGVDLDAAGTSARRAVERRWGILFQQGALFSSLTVRQNIQAPMREHLNLSQDLRDGLAAQKLALVGLPQDTGDKIPSELSGGMTKRVSLARALALDPEILIFDEPSAGLDPIVAAELDELILFLKRLFEMTIVVVTHEMDFARRVADWVVVFDKGKLIEEGPPGQIFDDPLVTRTRSFLSHLGWHGESTVGRGRLQAAGRPGLL